MSVEKSILRQVKISTIAISALTLLFFLFFDASKHQPALAKANVFGEDPYDAVGSFAIQLAVVAASLSLVRIARPYPRGITTGAVSLIIHGNAVSLLAILLTIAADWIAMIRFLPGWVNSRAGWLLAVFSGGLFALAILVGRVILKLGITLNLLLRTQSWRNTILICGAGFLVLAYYPEAWRQGVLGGVLTALVGMFILFILSSTLVKRIFSPGSGQVDDFLDDLAALSGSMTERIKFVPFLFSWLEKITGSSILKKCAEWLNPRKKAWFLAVLVGIGMGTALILAELLAEGAPARRIMLLVFAVFISLETAGMLLGYTLFKQFLGLFRPV